MFNFNNFTIMVHFSIVQKSFMEWQSTRLLFENSSDANEIAEKLKKINPSNEYLIVRL